ncbi:MAG TPA: response regulator [Planctomycetota bacterium]|nr:response regulator [Planctomycetota bacterium]
MTETPHLLVVDDEHFIRTALEIYFESHAYRVTTAGDGESALGCFESQHDEIDAVILDLVMPGTHGLDLLRRFKEIAPEIEVIIATGCASLGSAVEALRLGAFDYITKPILDFDADLMSSVRAAIEARRQTRELLRRAARAGSSTALTVGASHWASVFPRLNAFAAEHAEESAPERVLDGIGSILRECFLTDGALYLDRSTSGTWSPVYTWEFRGARHDGESWAKSALSTLDRLTADSKRFDVYISIDPRVALHTGIGDSESGLAFHGPLIVPVPLPVVSGKNRRWLSLYYRSPPPILLGRSPTVPFALLGTIVGPLLDRALGEESESDTAPKIATEA